MRISEVIRRKGATVITIRPDATVRDLLRVLEENGIGALVVSEDEGATLVGIVSERDVVRALHHDGASVLDAQVSALMTAEVATCLPEDDLESLAVPEPEPEPEPEAPEASAGAAAPAGLDAQGVAPAAAVLDTDEAEAESGQ